jgi:cytochrome c553
VAGSQRTFTIKQIHADYGPADWFPEDHPTMPDIVAHGKEANGIRACGLCHYPNGQGKPEYGPVAGLSVGYFLQQMADFKSGDRKSADPWKANATEMRAMAQALTDAEVKAAAEYFGSIRFRQWVKVVETDNVPKFTAGINGLFLTVKDTTETEALGQRLIEVPENVDETNLNRNPHSGFIAYVPMGTLKKGEDLTRTTACAVCHGADLRGVADVPAIAGRQASYLARQLYDFQQGSRNGVAAELMKGVVAKLSEGDILAIAAHVASRAP